MSEPLASVAEALGVGDFARALALALEVWRGSRHASIADLVDQIAAKVRPSHVLTGRGTPEQIQAEWMTVASGCEPRNLGLLLESLRHGIPHRDDDPDAIARRDGLWSARVAALGAFADDPRVARALTHALGEPFLELRKPTPEARVHALYDPMFDLLARLGDERSLAGLERIGERARERPPAVRAYCARNLPGVIAAITRACAAGPAPDPTSAAQARCDALLAGGHVDSVKHAPAATTLHGDLLEMVLASPDDDEPRQIYADALLEAGDPQGEFIAIQFKLVRGQATELDVLRLRELYRHNEPLWLGDLARVLVGRVYRGGFLERAALGRLQPGEDVRRVWEHASSDARLGTIRVLEPGAAEPAIYRRFALAPAMRHLEEVAILSLDMLDEICSKVGVWRFSCVVLHCPVDREILTRLASSPSLPRLREIAVLARPDAVADLTSVIARWPGRAQLDAFSLVLPRDVGVTNDTTPFRRWLSERSLAPIPRLGLWLPLSRIYSHASRNGRGLDVEVRDDLMLADVLERLSGFDELIVRPPPREVCCNLDSPWHFAAALRRLKAARVELPERWKVALARGY